MPTGTGAQTAQNVPDSPYVADPSAFFQLTKKNIATPHSFAAPGFGSFAEKQLPQAGIVSKLLITFDGEVTVTDNTGSVDSTNEYPYNLLREFILSINGSNDLWSVSGLDLRALSHVRHPSYAEDTDTFDGNEGANTGLTNGTTDLHLTWEVPVAMDDVSLVGALFLQSAATNATVRLKQAAESDIFTVNGDATVAVSGTFHITPITFEVPYREGKIVTPDLSRLHGMTALEYPLSATGTNRLTLLRADALLERVFLSVERSDGNPLSAQPGTADADKIDAVRLTYGANQTPLEFEPAAILAAINNRHYGQRVPYDRLVLDTVRENPARDAIHMQGVTELAAELDINSSVSLSNAKARVVQEMLL